MLYVPQRGLLGSCTGGGRLGAALAWACACAAVKRLDSSGCTGGSTEGSTGGSTGAAQSTAASLSPPTQMTGEPESEGDDDGAGPSGAAAAAGGAGAPRWGHEGYEEQQGRGGGGAGKYELWGRLAHAWCHMPGLRH